jgi:hypothetical protein
VNRPPATPSHYFLRHPTIFPESPRWDGNTRSRGLDVKSRFAEWAVMEWLLLACAVQRLRFPVGASPTRQPLQPEAIGAVMEVTKWLKPSISVSRIGDSASVAAKRFILDDKIAGTFIAPFQGETRARALRFI